MHKTITKLLMIFIAGLLTVSCDKTKEEITPASQLKSRMEYKGKTYDLSHGFWASEVDDDEDIEALELLLTTSSLKVKYERGEFQTFDGIINGIYLVTYMKKGTKGLDAGEYICDYDEVGNPNTFFGIVVLNSYPNGQLDFENFLESGKLTVKKNGSIYELTLNGTDEDGKAVKVFYKGELKSLE
jgi:hypothetical protein